MINRVFFPNAAFRDRALKALEHMLLDYYKAMGSLLCSVVFTGLRMEQEQGRLDLSDVAHFHREHDFLHQDMAVALLDGLISRIKKTGKDDAKTLLPLLEAVLDKEWVRLSDKGGRGMPRNGVAGARLGAFSKDL